MLQRQKELQMIFELTLLARKCLNLTLKGETISMSHSSIGNIMIKKVFRIRTETSVSPVLVHQQVRYFTLLDMRHGDLTLKKIGPV